MTLKQLYNHFPSEDICIEVIENIRWHGVPRCPHCKTSNFTPAKNERRYHCNTCNSTFSATAKTIFARTRCDLRKWFYAIYLLHTPTKRIPARELGEKLQTTKDTAWLIASKIEKAKIQSPSLLEEIINTINAKHKH